MYSRKLLFNGAWMIPTSAAATLDPKFMALSGSKVPSVALKCNLLTATLLPAATVPDSPRCASMLATREHKLICGEELGITRN